MQQEQEQQGKGQGQVGDIVVWRQRGGSVCRVSESEMLPYSSAQAAGEALGRDLTAAEAIWLKYTAHVPDCYLYFCNIPFLFLIFNLVPVPLVLLDALKIQAFERYKIQPGVHTSVREAWECWKKVMKVYITVVGPLQLSSYPLIKLVGIRAGLPLPSLWEVLLQLGVYFVVEDYGNYWLHRWLHSKWGYNNIHYVHHKFSAPMSFAAPHAHWAEVLILGVPAFLGPAITPGHMITFWLWVGLRQIEAIDTHSGYDFPWNPTKLIPFYGGAEYHDYHHLIGEKSQSNFASVFTYCDYIYGTDKGYRYHEKHKKWQQLQTTS